LVVHRVIWLVCRTWTWACFFGLLYFVLIVRNWLAIKD